MIVNYLSQKGITEKSISKYVNKAEKKKRAIENKIDVLQKNAQQLFKARYEVKDYQFNLNMLIAYIKEGSMERVAIKTGIKLSVVQKAIKLAKKVL